MTAKLSKHEKFKIIQVHRSQINNAPYNPRKISEHQKKGLSKNLKKVGMLQPIIWNETTGNIVSGHQRVAILDTMEKSNEYILTVAAVSLSEKEEMRQNMFLNSTTFTGEFDFEAVAELLENYDLDFKDCGFDDYDMSILSLEDADFERFQKPAPKHDVKYIVPEGEDDNDNDNDNDNAFNDEAEKVEAIKATKGRIKEDYATKNADIDAYIILSFSNIRNKEAFCNRFGFDKLEKMVKGEIFSEMVERVK